jgi:hypothetical protein
MLAMETPRVIAKVQRDVKLGRFRWIEPRKSRRRYARHGCLTVLGEPRARGDKTSGVDLK